MVAEPTPFGTLLQRYRRAAGLTQEALAERAHLSVRAISDLERGIIRLPRYDTLKLLLEALDATSEQRAMLLGAVRPEMVAASSASTAPWPLPLPPTKLLGRAQELAQAVTYLQQEGVRLLTLTGPSGVGKTRFALQLALDLSASFEAPAVFVPLAPLREAELVQTLLAQALGVREASSGSVAEQVLATLEGQHRLLVLDNGEHLREAAPFIAEVLARCPSLQLLLTSRAPWHVRGEQEMALAPLDLESAVALFRERAHAVQPERDYAWSDVAAVCEQLDRLPLAIELAARHVKVLALPLLRERLMTRLPLLEEGASDLPERQRTMRTAIAWSYELLTAAQQRCFRALGVFLGGWTLSAAEAVCGQDGMLESPEVLLALAALIDHSLVSSEEAGEGRTRFTMLETLREYALERLRAAEEEGPTRRDHAYYYAAQAEAAAKVPGPRDAHLMQEFPNARATLQWAAEQQDLALGLRLATYFGRLWYIAGQLQEAKGWLDYFLAQDARAGAQTAPLAVRSAALFMAGRLASGQGQVERATALAQEAFQVAEQGDDAAGMSLALANLGSLAQARSDLAQAARYFEASYKEAQRAGLPLVGMARLNLAEIARLQGDLVQARTLLEASLNEARQVGMPWGIANTLTLLGHLAREQQEYSRAKACYRESLDLYRTLGNASYTAWCLEGIAAVLCAEAHYEPAIQVAAAAAAVRVKEQTPLPPAEQKGFEKTVQTARGALGEAAFLEAWTTGSAWTQEEAIMQALSGIAF